MTMPQGFEFRGHQWPLDDLPAHRVYDATTFGVLPHVTWIDVDRGMLCRHILDENGGIKCYAGRPVIGTENRRVMIEFETDPPEPLSRVQWAPPEQ